jgi:hypothetical protein
MLLAIALALCNPSAASSAASPSVLGVQDQADPKQEYKQRRKAAEGNVQKLWELYEWCETVPALTAEGRACLRDILKLEDSRKAHELLGHVFHDGQWFNTEKQVAEYKEKKLADEAKKTGKVIYKGELVDPADVAQLEAGRVKVDGRWLSADEAKKLAEGWVRQDLEWVAPADLDKLEKGLWKCGDQWLAIAEADAYHRQVGRWWKIPSDHFLLYSTCPRAVSEDALKHMDHAFREIGRALGRVPQAPVPVLLLNHADQYGSFARGEAGVENPEASSLSSVHGCFFAETWLEPVDVAGSGAAVAYWDASNDAGNRFGEMFARHAAAQSLIEALDPSKKALENFKKGRFGEQPGRDFWSEKLVPRWFRYGVATYVERYMQDALVGAGGNPDWRREWSVSNIVSKGGLDPIDRIIAFDITVNDVPRSQKLYNEAGLLVAFVLDGKCTPVVQKHAAFKAALGSGDAKRIEEAGRELAAEIVANEANLRTFAGL